MRWLYDTAGFLTRSQCGTGWPAWLRETYQLANLMIWFTCLVSALSLVNIYRCKKSDLSAPGLFVVTAMFLVLCGLSHLGNVVSFVWAPYRLFTLVDLMAAALAVSAACRMPGVVLGMTRVPPQQLVQSVNQTLASEVKQAGRAKQELAQQVQLLKERNRVLEQMLKTKAWITEKNAVMEELSRDLAGNHSDREMP